MRTPKSIRCKATKMMNRATSLDNTADELAIQAHCICDKWAERDKELHRHSWGSTTEPDHAKIHDVIFSVAQDVVDQATEMKSEADRMRGQATAMYRQAEILEFAEKVDGDEEAGRFLYETSDGRGYCGRVHDFLNLWENYGFYTTGEVGSDIRPDFQTVRQAYAICQERGYAEARTFIESKVALTTKADGLPET